MQIIKIEVLEAYKSLSVYEFMDVLDQKYAEVAIFELETLRRLITKVRQLKDVDIYRMPLQSHLDSYPLFILTQSNTRQYLLFLELATGFSTSDQLRK
jgi:hypothetical protein